MWNGSEISRAIAPRSWLLAAPQAPRQEIGRVTELGGHPQDPLAGLVADGNTRLPAIQDPRDGRDRDARIEGNVAQRDRCLPARSIDPDRPVRASLRLSSNPG